MVTDFALPVRKLPPPRRVPEVFVTLPFQPVHRINLDLGMTVRTDRPIEEKRGPAFMSQMRHRQRLARLTGQSFRATTRLQTARLKETSNRIKKLMGSLPRCSRVPGFT